MRQKEHALFRLRHKNGVSHPYALDAQGEAEAAMGSVLADADIPLDDDEWKRVCAAIRARLKTKKGE